MIEWKNECIKSATMFYAGGGYFTYEGHFIGISAIDDVVSISFILINEFQSAAEKPDKKQITRLLNSIYVFDEVSDTHMQLGDLFERCCSSRIKYTTNDFGTVCQFKVNSESFMDCVSQSVFNLPEEESRPLTAEEESWFDGDFEVIGSDKEYSVYFDDIKVDISQLDDSSITFRSFKQCPSRKLEYVGYVVSPAVIRHLLKRLYVKSQRPVGIWFTADGGFKTSEKNAFLNNKILAQVEKAFTKNHGVIPLKQKLRTEFVTAKQTGNPFAALKGKVS